MATYLCPICGYPDLSRSPLAPENHSLPWHCPSCGFEFGVTDLHMRVSYEQWREDWIAQGTPWYSQRRAQPVDWQPLEHVQNALGPRVPIFSTPREFETRDRVDMWFAFSPYFTERPATLIAMLRDLLALTVPFGAHSIRTSEPCYYRTTDLGYTLLEAAVVNGQIEAMSLRGGDEAEDASIKGRCHLKLGALGPVPQAAVIDLILYPEQASVFAHVVNQYRAFIARWFQQLAAAAAAISFRGCGTAKEGDLGLTSQERAHGMLAEWHAVSQYVRGTFWGTALGAEQCARMGGQTRVLRDAPCPIKYPLGEGVWLQLSDLPPAELSVVESFARYLHPLQTWTEKDVHRPQVALRADPFVAGTVTAPDAPPVGPQVARQTFPVRYLLRSETNVTMTINVHVKALLATTPAILGDVVRSWYRDGQRGAFSHASAVPPFAPETYTRVFADLRGPTIGDSVMRWYVYQGVADRERALQGLFDRLSSLETPQISEVVIGTETLG